MAKRLTGVRKVGSEKIQGEGSWVKVKSLRLKKMRDIRNQRGKEGDDFDAFEVGVDLLVDHLVDWNWVDDNDQPMAIPSDDPSVLDTLTDQEIEFLTGVIAPSTKDLKN